MRTPALTALVAALALAAAGCGGGDDEGGEAAGGGGECAAAKAELLATVSERDRLFVDLQLDNAAKACAGELPEGTVVRCTEVRADLAEAASQETPPDNLEPRVDDAVAACVGTTLTSTLPPP